MKTQVRILKTGEIILGFAFLAACQNPKAHIKSRTKTQELEKTESKVIYGDDDRLDIYQETNATHRELADSAVGLFYTKDVTKNDQGNFNLLLDKTLGAELNLCETEPFREQPTAAWCSGALVGPDLILTAGHCVRSQIACDETTMVFNYAVKKAGVISASVAENDVYRCKEVVKQVLEGDGTDFALVRLDRAVVGHKVLKIRQNHSAKVGDELLMIGHPSGLPMKIAGGAKIRELTPRGFFVANTDSYGGNSGSAIFDPKSGHIVGVLVRGESDYDWSGTCRSSYKCTNDDCRGEDITDMTKIVEMAPEILQGQEPALPAISEFKGPGFNIPDAFVQGAASGMIVNALPEGRDVLIKVDITHPDISELVIQLKTPSGHLYTLHRRTGEGQSDLVGTFGADLKPVTSFATLNTLRKKGGYALIIYDRKRGKEGRVNSWSLIFKKSN